MSLFISSLNSGSNGNAYYVGNEHEAVLVDVGISRRDVEHRMVNLNLDISKVKAIFVSHEHTDHIRGVGSLSKKYKLPVFITQETLKHTRMRLGPGMHCSFAAHEQIKIGGLTVTGFTKHHDASDPYSFMIEHDGVRVGVITDIGIACEQVVHYFKQCHACFLEANYDERMLALGSYPARLKKRIMSDKGHLSNDQAVHLFLKHRPPFMSHLLLSHLSENNNHPELALAMFTKHNTSTNVLIASRHKETGVFKIVADPDTIPLKAKPFISRTTTQLALFP